MASELEEGNTEERTIPWERVGLGIVGILFGAYVYPPVLNGFGSLFNRVFGVLDVHLPFFVVVAVLAVLSGVYSAKVHTMSSNGGLDTSNKSRMKKLNKQRIEAEAAGDEERLQEIYNKQGEVMSEEFESLKQQFKPFIWVMVGSMPVFIWVYWKVTTGNIAAGEGSLVLPIVGASEWGSNVLLLDTWLVWYFLCSVTANMLTRRVIRFVKSGSST